MDRGSERHAAGSCSLLCSLNGTAITVSTLKSFYSSLPLSSVEESSLSYFLDDGIRVCEFERKVLDLYSPVGWVIPYP